MLKNGSLGTHVLLIVLNISGVHIDVVFALNSIPTLSNAIQYNTK